MMMKFLPFLCVAVAYGQTDLSKQINLVKELLPNATRCAVFYNSNDQTLPGLINTVSQETDMTIVQAPVKSVREMSTAMRQLKQYQPDFYLVIDDRVVGGPNSLKFLVKQANKLNKAVFTSSDNALDSGVFGKFSKKANVWYIQINGKVENMYSIVVPDGNVNYVVQNK